MRGSANARARPVQQERTKAKANGPRVGGRKYPPAKAMREGVLTELPLSQNLMIYIYILYIIIYIYMIFRDF